jgi:hypothetical protein
VSAETTPETTPQATPPNPPVTADPAALAAEVARLRGKNEELLAEKKRLAGRLADLPEDVDPRQLWAAHQAAETQRLEAEGNYAQARERLEQQYRDSETGLKTRIAELEAEIRQLRVLGPAATALSEHVHGPDEVLKLHLQADQLATEADGSVVVVNGYNRTPLAEWARATLPQWRLKAPKPAGTGAPPGGSSAGGGDGALPPGANPWQEGNLTQQIELANRDPQLAMRLAQAAGKRLVIRGQ